MQSNVELIANSVSKANDDIDANELVEIMQHAEIHPKDADKLASTVVYIRKRFIEKQSRYVAFKKGFPERCIPQENTTTPYPNTTGEVSRTAIEIKAKRLEQSQIYKKVVALLQTNLYIGYAMERMQVLDEALQLSLDQDVSHRDKAPFMKIFLEETRKPLEVKGMEVNMNFGEETTLKSIEEKMSIINSKLDGKSAEEIIDVLAMDKDC